MPQSFNILHWLCHRARSQKSMNKYVNVPGLHGKWVLFYMAHFIIWWVSQMFRMQSRKDGKCVSISPRWTLFKCNHDSTVLPLWINQHRQAVHFVFLLSQEKQMWIFFQTCKQRCFVSQTQKSWWKSNTQQCRRNSTINLYRFPITDTLICNSKLCELTFSNATLHLQENLLHLVLHSIDDLTAVLSHVFHRDISYHQGGVLTVLLPQEDSVLKASIGPFVEPHGTQHIFVKGLILRYLGPFDSDTDITKEMGLFAHDVTWQSHIGAEISNDLSWKKKRGQHERHLEESPAHRGHITDRQPFTIAFTPAGDPEAPISHSHRSKTSDTRGLSALGMSGSQWANIVRSIMSTLVHTASLTSTFRPHTACLVKTWWPLPGNNRHQMELCTQPLTPITSSKSWNNWAFWWGQYMEWSERNRAWWFHHGVNYCDRPRPFLLGWCLNSHPMTDCSACVSYLSWKIKP